MENYEDIFLPVAKSCRLHNTENETSNFLSSDLLNELLLAL